MEGRLDSPEVRALELELEKARRQSESAANLVRAVAYRLTHLRKKLGMTYPSVRAAITHIPRGEEFTIQRVVDLSGMKYDTVCGVCNKLWHHGRLIHVRRGVYMRKPT